MVFGALIVLSIGCRAPRPIHNTSLGAPLLELRLAYIRSTGDALPYTHRDTVYYLSRTAVLSDTSVTTARPALSPSGELHLDVRFSDNAAARLASSTNDHIGGRLALLLEARLVDVLPIASSAGGRGRLTINTGLRGAEAERFATRIRAKWPTS
jgi:preprotein translocase subunit SecD